jgi:hypothetical protein
MRPSQVVSQSDHATGTTSSSDPELLTSYAQLGSHL